MDASRAPLPVLITGASGGIGADLASLFAAAGHRCALVARDKARLEAVATALPGAADGPHIIADMDLSQPEAPAGLVAFLAAENFEPGILVNNAGFGLIGRAGDLDPATQLAMLDLNIRALTALTLAFLPGVERAKGRILNVASVAAFLPGPGMAAYYASKAYVLSFSEALWQEMRGRGVSVTALCPGPTATEFFQRAGARNTRLQQAAMMDSMVVAQAGFRGLMAGRRVVVPGLANKLTALLAPLTPRALLLPAIARLQRARR